MSAPTTTIGPPAKASWAAALAWYAAIGVTWLFATHERPVLLNHDVASITHTATRMLRGEILYRDIPEPNLPLVFLATQVPVRIASALHLDTRLVVHTSIVVVVLLAWILTVYVLEDVRLFDARGRRVFLGIALVVMFVIPGYDFGQREPVMFALALPWMCASVAAASGRRVSPGVAAAIGFTAGMGMSLKPFFVVLWFLVELWVIRVSKERRCWARTENAVMLATLCANGAFVLLGTEWLPNMAVWRSWGRPAGATGFPLELYPLVLQPWTLLGAWMMSTLVAARVDSERAAQLTRFRSGLAVAACAGLLTFAIQGKGFTYHALPTIMSAWILIGVCAATISSKWPTATMAWTVAGSIAYTLLGFDGRALLLGPGDLGVRYRCRAFESRERPDADGVCEIDDVLAFVEVQTEPGDAIAWVSTESMAGAQVTTALPVVDVRTVHPILIPNLYSASERATRPFPYHGASERTPLETRVLTALYDDLVRGQPRLVAFDVRRDIQGFGQDTTFDLLTFYRRDARLDALLEDGYVELPDTAADGTMAWFLRR